MRALEVELHATASELARLDHDRVAVEQPWDDVTIGQVHREVKRPQHHEHTERPVDRASIDPLRRGRARVLHPLCGHDADFCDQCACLSARFPQRLADLFGDRERELLAALRQRVREALEVGQPPLETEPIPPRKRRAGGIDRLIDRLGAPGRAKDNLVRITRIFALEHTLCPRLIDREPDAVDVVALVLH